MRVCVIGTGYVGLVTGACLAHTGHNVICVDNNAAKIEQLSAGQSPIYEPGLEAIMQAAMATGRLTFTTDLAAGVAHGDILFIAVGTPPLPTGESDTRYVDDCPAHLPASVQLCATPTHLAADCDALVLATDWPEFQTLDYAALAPLLHTPLLVDGRNCLDPAVVTQAGLVYIGIGRGVQPAGVAAPQEAERLAVQAA
jgi:UDP-glucose 6-dehydrogenase